MRSNFEKISKLTQRLVAAIAAGQSDSWGEGPTAPDLNQQVYGQAYNTYMNDMMANPAKMIEQQVGFWQQAVESWGAIVTKSVDEYKVPKNGAATNAQPASAKPKHTDRRFKSALWQDNPFFAAISQQYLASTDMLNDSLKDKVWDNPDEKRRAEFFAQQFISLMSPSNFLPTNPDALDLAFKTNGESLMRGLENLINDLESNDGRMGVALADESAFELGENVATSQGQVVFENRMFQLIQYSPSTKTVFETPLVIFPPWINKYYILDLQPDNSFIKYAVDSGLTVFVVSWVNPDETSGEIRFSDYMIEGALVAVNQACKITGQSQVNTIGYCIGGTLMTCTLAWLAKKDLTPIKSNTFFTTLTDFEDPGELGVFIEPQMISSMESMASKTGVLDAYYMGQIFSYLRPDNLVYGPAVKSYMMGEKPPAFDLLYWNGDSPNLPGKMVSEYLRELYMDNKLIKGEFVLGGEVLDMADVNVPIYAIATQTDHIAPWRASFKGLNTLGSTSKRFILAGSGHIAGVINPAGSVKYGYKTNPDMPDDLDAWESAASQNAGSWWGDWQDWISGFSGAKVPARQAGGPDHPVLEPAPGSYVKKKS